jgi:ABC-type branched-subunit amino acid transport system permease subunit
LLVAKRRIELHRQLGMFGVGLATLVILVGMPTLVNAAARRSHDVHSVRFLWMLVAFDGIALAVFAGLVAAAIVLRLRGDYHKRLMLLATLSLLGPAFGASQNMRVASGATAISESCYFALEPL